MKSKDIVRNVVASMAEARSVEMNEMQMEFEASSQEIGALIEVRTNKYVYVYEYEYAYVYVCVSLQKVKSSRACNKKFLFLFICILKHKLRVLENLLLYNLKSIHPSILI